MFKNAKNIAISFFGAGFLVYVGCGIVLSLTEQKFCAKVNRFVLSKDGEQLVSLLLPDQNEGKGYRIENVFYFPFQMHFGAELRRTRLIEGQSYEFTSVGMQRTFPRSYPIVVKEAPVDSCV